MIALIVFMFCFFFQIAFKLQTIYIALSFLVFLGLVLLICVTFFLYLRMNRVVYYYDVPDRIMIRFWWRNRKNVIEI